MSWRGGEGVCQAQRWPGNLERPGQAGLVRSDALITSRITSATRQITQSETPATLILTSGKETRLDHQGGGDDRLIQTGTLLQGASDHCHAGPDLSTTRDHLGEESRHTDKHSN